METNSNKESEDNSNPALEYHKLRSDIMNLLESYNPSFPSTSSKEDLMRFIESFHKELQIRLGIAIPKQNEERCGNASFNPYQEKRFSFADAMERFMRFYSPFMNLSKINTTRTFEPELNQLQEEIQQFHKKIDQLFFKIPKEFREGT